MHGEKFEGMTWRQNQTKEAEFLRKKVSILTGPLPLNMMLPCGGLFTIGNIFQTFTESTEQMYLLQLNRVELLGGELSFYALASLLAYSRYWLPLSRLANLLTGYHALSVILIIERTL